MSFESEKIEVDTSSVQNGVRLRINGEGKNANLIEQLSHLNGWASAAYVKEGQPYDKRDQPVYDPANALTFVAHANVVKHVLGILKTGGLINDATEAAAAVEADKSQQSIDGRVAKQGKPR